MIFLLVLILIAVLLISEAGRATLLICASIAGLLAVIAALVFGIMLISTSDINPDAVWVAIKSFGAIFLIAFAWCFFCSKAPLP